MKAAGLIKMRSRLGTQFMAFFWLIARILTFRDKKYRILTFRDKKFHILTFRNKKYRILTFHDKKYRILTFCDKTESYLTALQQNNAEACQRCEASLSFVISLPNAQLQLIYCCASLL